MRDDWGVWGRRALALGVALLGWQIGERAWHLSGASPPAAVIAHALPTLAWSPLLSLGPDAGSVPPRAIPGLDTPLWSLSSSPSDETTATAEEKGPSTPLIAVAGDRAEAFIGPPVDPDYAGTPLPLPGPEELRFLLRREPVAAARPVLPVWLAPPLKEPSTPRVEPPSKTALPASQPSTAPSGPRLAPASGVAAPNKGRDPGGDRSGEGAANGETVAAAAAPSDARRESEQAAPATGPGADGVKPSAVKARPGVASRPSPAVARENGPATPAATGNGSDQKPVEGATEVQGVGSAPGAAEPPVGEPTRGPRKADTSPPTAGAAEQEEPLRLHLRLLEGRAGRSGGAPRTVQITASEPCYLAAYQVESGGRVTPLWSLADAARVPPADSYRFAPRLKNGTSFCVVAIASRRPLLARAALRCLLTHLEEEHEAGARLTAEVAALNAVVSYLRRKGGPGTADAPVEENPPRPEWAVVVSPGGS